MSDREKVINDLQSQIEELEERLAIVLEGQQEKEQEAVKPKIDAFVHPYCPKFKILVYETCEFCPHCGQAVKWDA